MKYSNTQHTFAVCAYKESPYLAECLESLMKQKTRSRVIICTATPNDHISEIAERYQVPLMINTGPHGIAEDWNFAYKCADSPLITLAHQDDVYEPQYLTKVLDRLNIASDPLIAFTGYYEMRNGEKVSADNNKNLKIKRIALSPLKIRSFENSIWVRRRILSVCDPICCPAVTFVKDALPETVFTSGFQADLDWQAWEKLSRLKGSFVYIPEDLMAHRIHTGSATTEVIGDNDGRSQEDLEMYRLFWPEPVAKLLNHFYSAGQKSNQL